MAIASEAGKPEVLSTLSLKSLARVRLGEAVIYAVLTACAIFSVLVTASIVLLLISQSVRFFGFPEVSLQQFLTGTEWNPLLGAEKNFGVLPLIVGTLLVTVVAMIVALPLGLITAIFLSEYAPRSVRALLKPILEILAGVPTVVYGFFALTVITPFLRDALRLQVDYYNALSAGIAVGILCLPTVASLTEDALQAVPRRLRDAAFGLGGTRFDVSIRVVVPAALSGIISSSLLAVARAVGETMIVALAAGSVASMTFDPRNQIQTITAYITQVAKGDVENFGVEYYSIYAVASTLFLMTLTLTILGHLVRKRYREAYE
jgi:phosphate transport system permease protein